jgi:hypothetical protein
MEVIELGRLIEVSALQEAKAQSPMEVIELGNSIEVREVQ